MPQPKPLPPHPATLDYRGQPMTDLDALGRRRRLCACLVYLQDHELLCDRCWSKDQAIRRFWAQIGGLSR